MLPKPDKQLQEKKIEINITHKYKYKGFLLRYKYCTTDIFKTYSLDCETCLHHDFLDSSIRLIMGIVAV